MRSDIITIVSLGLGWAVATALFVITFMVWLGPDHTAIVWLNTYGEADFEVVGTFLIMVLLGVVFWVELFNWNPFLCKYAETCDGYAEDAYTCNNGGGSYCGLWRRFKKEELFRIKEAIK